MNEAIWIIPKSNDGDNRPYCSACNMRVPFHKEAVTFLKQHNLLGELSGYMKYCFNCGAKMQMTKVD